MECTSLSNFIVFQIVMTLFWYCHFLKKNNAIINVNDSEIQLNGIVIKLMLRCQNVTESKRPLAETSPTQSKRTRP